MFEFKLEQKSPATLTVTSSHSCDTHSLTDSQSEKKKSVDGPWNSIFMYVIPNQLLNHDLFTLFSQKLGVVWLSIISSQYHIGSTVAMCVRLK